MPAREDDGEAQRRSQTAGAHYGTGIEGIGGTKKKLLAGSQWVRAPNRIPRGRWLEAPSSRIHHFLYTSAKSSSSLSQVARLPTVGDT